MARLLQKIKALPEIWKAMTHQQGQRFTDLTL